MSDDLDKWRNRHNARFGIGTGRLVSIEEPTDDPHDSMMPTPRQIARAEAEARERRQVAENPERALIDPEGAPGIWGWIVLGVIVCVAMAWFFLPS